MFVQVVVGLLCSCVGYCTNSVANALGIFDSCFLVRAALPSILDFIRRGLKVLRRISISSMLLWMSGFFELRYFMFGVLYLLYCFKTRVQTAYDFDYDYDYDYGQSGSSGI
jgi:hypothetical protein